MLVNGTDIDTKIDNAISTSSNVVFSVTRTSSISLTTSPQVVPYNSKIIDTNNSYNTSTYKYTIPVSGNWCISWSIYTITYGGVACSLYKNSTLVGTMSEQAASVFDKQRTHIIPCVAGELIWIQNNNYTQTNGVVAGGRLTVNNVCIFGGFLL